MYFNRCKSILYFLVLCFFVGCPSENIPGIIPEEEIPEEEIPRKEIPEEIVIRTEAEINAAVLEVLKKYAPEVVDMEPSIDQVIALMDTIHNATQYNDDPRQWSAEPDELLELIFTDPEFGLNCSKYSYAMINALIALNYKNRGIQFFYVGPNGPDGHNANEVMINEKLYALDATFNIVFKDDENNFLSYKEAKDRTNGGNSLIVEYVGETKFPLENLSMPYENWFSQTVRALPFWCTFLFELYQRVDGEEFL